MVGEPRILIVDDEESNVVLLERILARTGFTDVTSSTKSLEALPLYRELSPDILLLDLAMPTPDGMAIMRRIREGSDGLDAPILVLTAETSRETRLEALAAGATDFVTKPFDASEVVLRVRNLLEIRRMHVQLRTQKDALEETVQERTSELREAYEAAQESAERLRVLEQAKDAFLVSVSHELRTPLAVLVGSAALLERGLDRLSSEQVADVVSGLAAGARRLERLMTGLLDADRIRRGLVEPMRRPTEIRPMVERVLEELDLKGHPLELLVQDGSAEVDPAHVERILEHLLANAVRHTPPASPIRLEVMCGDGDLLIVVDDEGAGIPEDRKEAIFERFAQATVPEHAPGLGLGLALVAQFAGLHGGRAWVQDRLGGGSSFRVRLPTASEAPSTLPAAG